MGRRPLSDYPPEVAAQMRADYAKERRRQWEEGTFANRVNGALQAEVQQRISTSVRQKWVEGDYANRVNGMQGVIGAKHSNWTWGRPHFREILFQHEVLKCAFCGKDGEEFKLDVHHIDEDWDNYLLSNLIATCVTCHHWRFHCREGRFPQVTIGKKFGFEYAHILPWHPGKCGSLHGHSGHISVEITNRLDPNGVVEDFYDIGQIVKLALIDRLDHKFLNDFLPNPTSEELLVYAWHELELAGLKGLSKLQFSETDSSYAYITAKQMLEAFGWDRTVEDKWAFVAKPTRQEKVHEGNSL
jgi:6-pyruvoyltetrahydropterin/6-carboxytetrahydropterin synthase